MAYRIAWSSEAVEDVESIANYIARDSAHYASAVVNRIVACTRNLIHFPLAGHIVPELNDDAIRERFVYSYRVIYRIKSEVITIAAVIHGKRLLEPMKDRFKEMES